MSGDYPERLFTVGTFYEEREGRKPRVSAYTRWWLPDWKGCKIYEIWAANGAAAKAYAIRARKAHEKALAVSAAIAALPEDHS